MFSISGCKGNIIMIRLLETAHDQEVSTNVRYGDSALRFELRKDS